MWLCFLSSACFELLPKTIAVITVFQNLFYFISSQWEFHTDAKHEQYGNRQHNERAFGTV